MESRSLHSGPKKHHDAGQMITPFVACLRISVSVTVAPLSFAGYDAFVAITSSVCSIRRPDSIVYRQSVIRNTFSAMHHLRSSETCAQPGPR